ncbi:hypothetical protein OM076_11135 [Solirubrobacter ginsenosidimutans]|uniref:Uncharacterized protein n=1 Tax=Solirubrobacter ginsenosidimutans TaxID=490573 RepID=A0A9X3MQL3_9ACTN|nr:hypothetical protein [Solirubrobacter ginsenosidimutans]
MHHLDLVRNGAVVATSPTTGYYASLDVPTLLAGDVARFYDGNAVSATAAYDGQPTIGSDACAPHVSFTATRSDTHSVYNAGAFPANDYTAVNRSINTTGNPFTVTLQSPLAVGDVAFVVTQGLQSNGKVGVEFVRYAKVAPCPAPSTPAGDAPTTTTAPAAPTDAQVRAKVRAAVASTAARLKALKTRQLAKRKSVRLPFAFSEPGKVKLTLTGPRGKPIGAGEKTATAAGTSTVTVKLSAAGRKLLKAARKIAVTVKATFTPARAGAKPQTASAGVKLKR